MSQLVIVKALCEGKCISIPFLQMGELWLARESILVNKQIKEKETEIWTAAQEMTINITEMTGWGFVILAVLLIENVKFRYENYCMAEE